MVVLESCASYEYDAVKTAVKAIFDACGGIGKLVAPGTKVALKPNLVAKRKPEEAATTHPSVLRAVVELCVEAGGSVIVCESPGGVYDKAILKGLYKGTGIEEAALSAGAELNYELSVTKVDNPDGMYMTGWCTENGYGTADAALEWYRRAAEKGSAEAAEAAALLEKTMEEND